MKLLLGAGTKRKVESYRLDLPFGRSPHALRPTGLPARRPGLQARSEHDVEGVAQMLGIVRAGVERLSIKYSHSKDQIRDRRRRSHDDFPALAFSRRRGLELAGKSIVFLWNLSHPSSLIPHPLNLRRPCRGGGSVPNHVVWLLSQLHRADSWITWRCSLLAQHAVGLGDRLIL